MLSRVVAVASVRHTVYNYSAGYIWLSFGVIEIIFKYFGNRILLKSVPGGDASAAHITDSI